MADKPKTQEAQEMQKPQGKRQKAKPLDIAIQDAKNEKNAKQVPFTNKDTGKVHNITISMPDEKDALYLDELDPESPTYNPEKIARYKEQLKEHSSKIAAAYIDAADRINGTFLRLEKMSETISKQLRLSETLQAIADSIRDAIPPDLKERAELFSYIEKEAEKPKYKKYGSDLATILDAIEAEGTDQDGNILPGSTWETLINDARAAQEKDKISTTAKRAEALEFPLDKVNSTVWGLLEKDTQGQIALKAEKSGSKEPLSIFYAINFDALENVHISKRLTAFDKTVYVAAAALFNAGNEWITLTQIFYAMGNERKKKPAPNQLEAILNSLRKMKAADIFIDNAQEAGKYNYPVFKYEGDLLPTEKITATINGKLTDAAIHLFREPPLVTFAKQRNQVTTISVKLLAAPISKTEKHLAIQDYLLERISRAKHGTKKQERILFATLAEKAKDTTGKKSRLQEAAETYLKHFKAEAWISSYTTDKDGITIYL